MPNSPSGEMEEGEFFSKRKDEQPNFDVRQAAFRWIFRIEQDKRAIAGIHRRNIGFEKPVMNRTAVASFHNEQFLSSRYDDHPWLFFAPAPREAK